MGVTEHLRVIWRRKWRVLAVALLLAAIVYIRSDASPDTYRAEAVLAVTPGRVDAGPDVAARLARSAAVLAGTRTVLLRAIEDGKLQLGASAARDDVQARSTDDGFVIVEGDGDSPRRAEALAGAVANALVTTIQSGQEAVREDAVAPAADDLADLERQLGSRDLAADAPIRAALLARYTELNRAVTEARLRPLDRAEVVSPARAAGEPVAPTPARDGLLTFAGALLAFSLLAVLVEVLSDRFSTERPAEEAVRVTGLPVLAEIPRTGGAEVVEAFRTLRTSLMFMSTSERLRTLAVVSVDPGAGKTSTALNLAREAAALEVPVVLIDGDLRRPILHERLQLPRSPGLSEALAGRADTTEIGHLVGDGGWLRVVPSGAPVGDPSGLFGGRSFREALDNMTWAELVIVDTPAGGLFADALAIASQCDATLVVVDAQNSKRRPVRDLVESLRQVSAQPIGIVLNRTEPAPRPSYYEVKTPRSQKEPKARKPAAPTKP
jgi:capsular exopolysaccharide synthesis family protein